MLMTGRWPYQQGLIANHMSPGRSGRPPRTGSAPAAPLSCAFKDAGYITAPIGKWPLGGDDARPFGFDRSVVWSGTNDHRCSRYSVDGAPLTEWTGQSNATAMTTQALGWIEAVHGEPQPFFLILSLNQPHGPYDDAPEEYTALYPDTAALPWHPLDQLRDWVTHRSDHAFVSNVDAGGRPGAAQIGRTGDRGRHRAGLHLGPRRHEWRQWRRLRSKAPSERRNRPGCRSSCGGLDCRPAARSIRWPRRSICFPRWPDWPTCRAACAPRTRPAPRHRSTTSCRSRAPTSRVFCETSQVRPWGRRSFSCIRPT